MKEVLIITNYFPPETGAASNRIAHLAEALAENSFEVTVIAPLPNYPNGKIFEGFRGKFKHVSSHKGVRLIRLWLFASNSRSIFKRMLAMISFGFSLSLHLLFNRSPNTVIIQSPPLLVAFSAIFWLRSKKRMVVLNVSDLWPLAGKELGVLKNGFRYNILKKIEQFNYRNAQVIWGQSQEILDHIKPIARTEELHLYRNYPNIDVSHPIYASDSGKLKLVYAGLLGVAQGIVKMCSELDYSGIELHIYGAGVEKKQLESLISSNPDWPIIYHGEVTRTELHESLPDYDVVLIPLLNRIYGSVPSKIFEYAKLGLPMIYFGGGEGEDIIREHKLGWVVPPADYDSLNQTIASIGISEISMERKSEIKETAMKEFDFNRQFQRLIQAI